MAPSTPGPGSRTRDSVTWPGTTVTGRVTPGSSPVKQGVTSIRWPGPPPLPCRPGQGGALRLDRLGLVAIVIEGEAVRRGARRVAPVDQLHELRPIPLQRDNPSPTPVPGQTPAICFTVERAPGRYGIPARFTVEHPLPEGATHGCHDQPAQP